MVLFRFKHKLLALALASVMVLALACGEDEDAATAVPAAAQPTTAPIAVATLAPTPVPAVAAATAAPAVVAATVAPAAMEKAEAHLRMAQGDDANTMYCGNSTSVASVMYGKAMCDGSIEFLQDVLLGRLVTSWESNADSTEWTYQLRKGVEFHDGDPFNAQALKAHLDFIRTTDHALMGENRTIYGAQVESVDVLDDFSVRLNMYKSRPIWPLDETWWANGVANQRALDEVGLDAFLEDPVGTGAFKFISWERLNKVVMEANRDWWGPEAQTTPALVSAFTIPEPATRLAALLTDEIDWLINPLTPQIEIIEASPNHRVMIKEQYDVITSFLNWNREPVLKERRLRQAISEAINYQAIVDDILLGTAKILRNNLPNTSAYYDPNAEPFPKYDPENAKRLVADLKAEGLYNDEPIGFLSPRSVYPEDVRATLAMVAMMQEAGINAVADILDSALRASKYKNQACDWDLMMMLPVDGYGDMQGWLWPIAGGRPDAFSWCLTESVEGSGDWGDPFVNEWVRQGLIAESLPVGPGRDAAWVEALSQLNQAYIHQGLYQISFVYGVSNEWDFIPDSHESTFIYNFKKR